MEVKPPNPGIHDNSNSISPSPCQHPKSTNVRHFKHIILYNHCASLHETQWLLQLCSTCSQTLHTENHCVTKTVIAILKQEIISKPRKIKCVYIKLHFQKYTLYVYTSPQSYHYFIAVVGFVWSNDPESYAGGSVATARVSLAGQVEGDNADKKGIPLSSRLGVGA